MFCRQHSTTHYQKTEPALLNNPNLIVSFTSLQLSWEEISCLKKKTAENKTACLVNSKTSSIFNANKRSRKPKGQSRMDNPEKLATLGTQDSGQKQTKPQIKQQRKLKRWATGFINNASHLANILNGSNKQLANIWLEKLYWSHQENVYIMYCGSLYMTIKLVFVVSPLNTQR